MGGVIQAKDIGVVNMQGYDGNYHEAVKITMSGSGLIVVPTCNVTTPNVNIPLGTWDTASFTNVGSTSTSVPFAVSVNCSGGNTVFASINADPDSSQAGTIKITNSSGSASGVGIQLLDSSNTPLDVSAGNVAGRITSALAGINTFNWKARYIKTAATIAPGDANAVATVTLYYQ